MMQTGLHSSYEARQHQITAVQRTKADLLAKGSALIVVPTGGGKTVIAGFTLLDEMTDDPFARAMVLQNTDEQLRQNRRTISDITAPIGAKISTVKGRKDDWDGDIIFASTATVMRAPRLKRMPFLTHIIIDEAHRAATRGVKAIIKRAREINPAVRIVGYTATPNRSDGQTLKSVIGDLTYQITYAELIDLGYLVPVRTLTIDLGLNAELEEVPLVAGEYDMDTVGQILNRKVHNEAVVDKWWAHAHGRQTIAFCSTVDHAKDLAQAFRDRGVVSACVHGDMDADERRDMLAAYAAGRITVITNCMVLTEGYDDPMTSCILIVRPMVSEITFLQGIGRGMRALDELKYPGIVKANCVVLDFAGAAVRHNTIEIRVAEEREAAARALSVPKATNDNWKEQKPKRTIRHFGMREIDLMGQVKPKYVQVDGIHPCMIAIHRGAWAGAFNHGGQWMSLSRKGDEDVHAIACKTANEAMAWADRFLAGDNGERMRGLEMRPPTKEQKVQMRRFLMTDPRAMTSAYDAECHITVVRSRIAIRRAFETRRTLPFAA